MLLMCLLVLSMIDLHSHLLPGIDDGAPDLATAIAMAKIAVDDGITHMMCTPHIHTGRYDNTMETIQQALSELQQSLVVEQVDLVINAAAEVRFGMELMVAVQQNNIPFLGEWEGQPVLLLEFPHGEIPFGAERLTAWLLQQGIKPLIAHPERNKGLLRAPNKLKPFIEQSCLLQMTAGSVAGHFGKPVQEIAHKLLKENLVTILASDAHNTDYRPPILSQGRDAAAQLIGKLAADRLVLDNPWQIAESKLS